MSFVNILIPLFLCWVAILVLNLWSSNRQQQKPLGFSSSPLLVFSVFNTIIIAILIGNYRPSTEEVEGVMPPFLPQNEEDKDAQDDTGDYINGKEDENEDEDEDEEYHGSDGYDEDDDDNSSDDEICWQDDEEYDNNLERRIESFIAKVNEEWRKERLREISYKQP
uniref:Uncharacterized protein n=1 Tax=Quercus lobata TaxID=97700 RepID=A0A7N2N326_QUELO